MFFTSSSQGVEQISTDRAVRHLVVFQIKLALDALRDLALSPISILVFIIDAIRKPTVEDSLYLRLMLAGRDSDRVINLFGEHSEGDHYTVDKTLTEVEQVVSREMQKKGRTQRK